MPGYGRDKRKDNLRMLVELAACARPSVQDAFFCHIHTRDISHF